MEPDFISNLLKGAGGSSPLTALLPLLLGGNKPNLSSLFGSFGESNTKSNVDEFPPLFGRSDQTQSATDNGIFNVLNRFFSTRQDAQSNCKTTVQYPYELQYNRPDIHKMHKN